jgi:hypothetical protein
MFVRIIDPSLFSEENKNGQLSVSIKISGSTIESLPSFKRIGEILRLHRCNIGQYKHLKQFNANMNYGTSWVIFEGIPRSNRTVMQEAPS